MGMNNPNLLLGTGRGRRGRSGGVAPPPAGFLAKFLAADAASPAATWPGDAAGTKWTTSATYEGTAMTKTTGMGGYAAVVGDGTSQSRVTNDLGAGNEVGWDAGSLYVVGADWEAAATNVEGMLLRSSGNDGDINDLGMLFSVGKTGDNWLLRVEWDDRSWEFGIPAGSGNGAGWNLGSLLAADFALGALVGVRTLWVDPAWTMKVDILTSAGTRQSITQTNDGRNGVDSRSVVTHAYSVGEAKSAHKLQAWALYGTSLSDSDHETAMAYFASLVGLVLP